MNVASCGSGAGVPFATPGFGRDLEEIWPFGGLPGGMTCVVVIFLGGDIGAFEIFVDAG
jgi:hypothetical protein